MLERMSRDRGLSEELRMMRQSCRQFVDDIVLPYIKQNWQKEWSMVPEERLPVSILEAADKIGIRTLGVPEEYGGVELEKGTEVKTFAVISEEIARGDSGLADKMVQNWKVSVLLRELAPKHLQDKWFPELVNNPKFLMAHCLTEPRGASDRWLPYNVPEAAMQTKAVKVNGGWVINGRKQFISNGYDASLYVVYANSNPKVGMLQGTSSFLVPRDTKGFSVARCNETLGCRFMNNGEMVFEDMFIPDDQLLVQDSAMGSAGVYFRPGKIIQAAKNLGVTHVTNGCYRLHPTEWNVGESAALLASFCLTTKTSPHQVHGDRGLLRQYQALLRTHGIPLAWPWENGRGLE